jgi:hypothetical protein
MLQPQMRIRSLAQHDPAALAAASKAAPPEQSHAAPPPPPSPPPSPTRGATRGAPRPLPAPARGLTPGGDHGRSPARGLTPAVLSATTPTRLPPCEVSGVSLLRPLTGVALLHPNAAAALRRPPPLSHPPRPQGRASPPPPLGVGGFGRTLPPASGGFKPSGSRGSFASLPLDISDDTMASRGCSGYADAALRSPELSYVGFSPQKFR